MSRRLRLHYAGAIYHLMARGNGRQEIVRDDADRERLQEDLGKAASRCSWRVYAYVIMPNHLHIVLKTPEPNLARGMQTFLSAYAIYGRGVTSFLGMFSLARSHTLATNVELAAVLGLSRAGECAELLTRRLRDWLSTDTRIREQLRDLEGVLDGS